MLIDDDIEEHDLIKRQLRGAPDLRFQAFLTCKGAVDDLAIEQPDVILLDAQRTRSITPIDAANEIRGAGITCPIVLISTLEQTDAPGAPFADFVVKDRLTWERLSQFL